MTQSLFRNLSDEISTEEHLITTHEIMGALTRFHHVREATYQMSFAKRGEVGVWMNLARKYDRLEELVPDLIESRLPSTTLIDTLVDTAMYALKWLAVIQATRQEDLIAWIQNTYCNETGIEFEDGLRSFGIVLEEEKDDPG